MISLDRYISLVVESISKFKQFPPNEQQTKCILYPTHNPLMIVAGPGTGKTTVLVLKALKLVFVNGILPEQIILTTFTKKAAEEIRARLIEWGITIQDYLKKNPDFEKHLESIDINRFVTGTLDSICEDILTTYRDPGDPATVLVEGFVGNAFLMRKGLFAKGIHKNQEVAKYLAKFTFDGRPPGNFAERLKISRTIMDRFIHDHVDLEAYASHNDFQEARNTLVGAAKLYWKFMESSNRMDFAQLENTFYERLKQGRLSRFTTDVKAILVDEYQDTNPLQESIYFEIIKQTEAAFTIVGDDDQSLYRFRGATVELFRDFSKRFLSSIPGNQKPHVEYLVNNYRSTPEVVRFFNTFITNDPSFLPARVQPPKPSIVPQLRSNGFPILGLFRPNVEQLQEDLVRFLMDVFRGKGREIEINGQRLNLIASSGGGNFGDCVFLSRTVNEFKGSFGNQPPSPRLPFLLRKGLANQNVLVFNPRGRALRDTYVIQKLLGIILECIDPPDTDNPYGIQQTYLTNQNFLYSDSRKYFATWREVARKFVESNPIPNKPHTLKKFIESWQRRKPQTKGTKWPEEWPLLELCFKVICWIPELRDDPEGQVYLEAITRCISQAATFSPYRSTIVMGEYGTKSIHRAFLDIFSQIAEGNVEIDEEIMPHVPRDRMQFMTIHQSKGLEFPLVIVDVSSDYKNDHPKNRFSRFPDSPSNTQILEDDLAPFSAVGNLRQLRPALDRTYEDLIRLYYVAYSRPQSVLLLVGLDPCLQYSTTIKHIATFWKANGNWAWQSPYQGDRPPALANNIPLKLI
ncbi:MAG: DEAD/DEAH box helicase [Leptospiraceae bacterium]|nr:DEAD/DEAH box helicase [Leptospiraceae bacterium]